MQADVYSPSSTQSTPRESAGFQDSALWDALSPASQGQRPLHSLVATGPRYDEPSRRSRPLSLSLNG